MAPPSHTYWQTSYEIMKTAFLMVDLLDLGTLDAYAKTIRGYAETYGG